jgi:hypothetical protein
MEISTVSTDNAFEGTVSRPSRVQQIRSSFARLFKDISWAFTTASDGVQDWTPFCLVVSYFAFSICIYMVASSGVMKVFWFVYLMTNTYIASVCNSPGHFIFLFGGFNVFLNVSEVLRH